jgi:hypothetical protein
MSRFMDELESALGTSAAADVKEDDSDWESESGTCYFIEMEKSEHKKDISEGMVEAHATAVTEIFM